MTAIGMVGVSAGFLLGADGRMRLDDESRATANPLLLSRETDNAQKIFPVEASGLAIAFSLAGLVANNDFTTDLVRDANQQMARVANRNFDSHKNLVRTFANNLAETITEAKHFPEQEKRDHGWHILDGFVVGYFRREPFLVHLAFYHQGGAAGFIQTPLGLGGFLYGQAPHTILVRER